MKIDKLIQIKNEIWNCQTEHLDSIKALERQRWYGWLFEGSHADIQIPLWESAYVGEQNVLLNQQTLSVIQEYLSEGLEADEDCCHQPADYLGFELEYFLFLLKKRKTEKALQFYQQHLKVLLQAVFEKVLRYSKDEYYSELAGTALELAADSDQWDAEKLLADASELAANQKKEQSKQEFHFHKISEMEAQKKLQQKSIKSAGRGNCGGACAMLVDTAAGCVLDVNSCDQTKNPLSAPLCVRGKNYRGTYLTPERLRYPMLRVGRRGEGKFQRISWQEALDLMTDKIRFYTEKYGPGCRFVGYSSGVTSIISGDFVLRRMFGLGGGYLGNFNSYSSASIFYTLPYVYGTAVTGSSLASFYDTRLAILWGNNPAVTEHCDEWIKLIRKLKENHTKVILIDPHYNETGKALGAEWIPIRPDTDASLAAAMAYVLWDEGLCDQDFMNRYCIGFDREHMPEDLEEEESYRDYIFGSFDHIPKTPEWAEQYTGIPAEKIRYLAREYAKGPAAIFAGRGCQRTASGEQIVRSITALACMMGYVGKKGGGTGYHCAAIRHQAPGYPFGPNPYKGRIPTFLWTDAILDGKNMTRQKDHIQGREKLESDIKIYFSIAGNTMLNQHSDLNRTAEILKDESKCEFIVVSDTHMTPSARYADLLLPGTSLFEDEFMTKPWSDGNYLLYANRCIEPLFESRFEVDWILELADRLGIEDTAEGCSSVSEWYRMMYERTRKAETELPDYETFRENGGYHYQNNPDQIGFEMEIKDPDHHKFQTGSGKIEIFSRKLWDYHEDEIPAVPKFIRAFEGVQDPLIRKYPLQLIGWHIKNRTHSIGDQNEKLEKTQPHCLWIHPQDAAKREIREGDLVEVYNDRGVVRIKAELSEDIMPGVICIPEGAWYTPDEKGVDIRGCVNTLTTMQPTALAKANPQHSCLAEVRKLTS